MLNRRRLTIVFATTFSIAVIFVVASVGDKTWLSPESLSIHIVIENHTDQPIGPFVIWEHQRPSAVRMDQIEAFSVSDVYYEKPESSGENAIVLTDRHGEQYPLIPYFEGQQKGRVDIRVECVTADGLAGRKRDLTLLYFSLKWHAWGTSVCN